MSPRPGWHAAVEAAAEALYERRHAAVGMTYREWSVEAARAALKAAQPFLGIDGERGAGQ